MRTLLLLAVCAGCATPVEEPVLEPAVSKADQPGPDRAGLPGPDGLGSPAILRETFHFPRVAGAGMVAAAGAHCGRCNTRWGDADLAAHERHLKEQNLMMSTACKLCRYHGAYKNMLYVRASDKRGDAAKAGPKPKAFSKPKGLLRDPPGIGQ